MKLFPNDAKKISIVFICDACGEETPMEPIEVSETCEMQLSAVCPVCFKEFDVKVMRDGDKSWVEVEDVGDGDITITVL